MYEGGGKGNEGGGLVVRGSVGGEGWALMGRERVWAGGERGGTEGGDHRAGGVMNFLIGLPS